MFIVPPTQLGERYSPLYFLSALGAGGLAVSFFMYLLFWVPHPNAVVPVFEDIAAVFQAGNDAQRTMVLLAWVGIAFFGLLHFLLLAWNIAERRLWESTEARAVLHAGNAETQMLAIPLTLAMSLNVSFILGLVFVPGLWSVVEYLFPLAMGGFLAFGAYAFKLLAGFFGRVLTKGGFDCAANNSFSQLLPSFALAMVSVGLAAPAAMSHIKLVVGVSVIASTFFMVAALLLAGLQLVLGFRAMLEHGVNDEAAPSLWVAIPIVTVLSIATLRMGHGLHDALEFGSDGAFPWLTKLLAVQLLFALAGYSVLRRIGYFRRFVFGDAISPGAWALTCPGVALSVMLHFWINKALVPAGLVVKFGPGYWSLTSLALLVQATTIWLLFKLSVKHFSPRLSMAIDQRSSTDERRHAT